MRRLAACWRTPRGIRCTWRGCSRCNASANRRIVRTIGQMGRC
jgi:hypothetical protein